MPSALADPRIQKILSPGGRDTTWRDELKRLRDGDASLDRRSAREAAIAALQRMMVFLGYSTSSTGAFLVDGDFGRGTNRGLAQFRLEHGLGGRLRARDLAYPCSWRNAHREIVAVPEIRLDIDAVEKVLAVAVAAIDANEVPLGRFEDALFHLDAVQSGRFMRCDEILRRYGRHAERAAATLAEERGVEIRPEWILAIIRQETAGIVRPRFEQHKLSKFHRENAGADFAELRIRSMSFGLGQIMGFNYAKVGASSARAMLYSPIAEQVLYVARFLSLKREVMEKSAPREADFRTVARYYNGPKYEDHLYHVKLERWFDEFQRLRGD